MGSNVNFFIIGIVIVLIIIALAAFWVIKFSKYNRKVIIASSAIVLFLVISTASLFAVGYNHYNRLITSKKEKLKSITVELYDESNGIENTIVLTEHEDMKLLYSEIKGIKTKANLYPEHYDSPKRDILYKMTIEYNNQKTDVIFEEISHMVYRHLETQKSDDGFAYGDSTGGLYNTILTFAREAAE